MKAIITSDLHLTDRPQDEYRWGIFPWLVNQSKELEVENLFILGDLTDFKDKHSAKIILKE
jgi:UDP-2,3-diacylglucosamine pyrophosphatase LpxH